MARTADDRSFPYYPAFLDLRHKRVVVVGGGEIAAAKVRGLLPCGPEPLVVVAPEASALIRAEAALGRLVWHGRGYREGDLAAAHVAFAATDDRALNATVAAEARRRGVPVLAVDDIPNCDFIAPAVVKRGDLVVAISTGGRSPAMARRTREWLERQLPPHWGDLLAVAARAREQLGAARALVAPEEWQAALDDQLEELVRDGALEEAGRRLLDRLAPGPRVPATARLARLPRAARRAGR